MIYIGQAKLGYTESEILGMTPRKFFLVYDEYLALNGFAKRKKKACTIDDLP